MRVLFTSQPSLGHWHPLVALAHALESADHEVAFASTPGFCPIIEANGFRCFHAGTDDTDEELRRRREQLKGLAPKAQAEYMLKNVFAGARAERSLADLLDIIRDWRADAVVHENIEFGGCVAAERAGIPHAVVQVAAPRAHYLPAVEASLNRLCASIGLPQQKPDELLYRYLVLSPRPPRLWDPSVPVPPTTHTFRYTGFSQSGEEQLPSWVADLDRQRPTVYATLGTVNNSLTAIFSAILEGLRGEPINLILAIGRDQDPMQFGEQPAHVHVERYVPQNLLLPYCDLVVSHGGSGTIMDALSVGLPMVIIPFAADQPENARLCSELGVARVIEPDGRTATAIRDAAREVLQNPQYCQAAQRLCKEIEQLPELESTVALVEKLAAEAPGLHGKGH